MTSPADSHLLLRAFADELARCNIAGACTSPGSRSSPLVLALAAEARIATWSHLDERVAGFFGLGLAQASGRPAVLACTSGTAAAHYLPAVIEAHEAGVPLVLLTADRPPELREIGAGQAVDQLKLFGDAVRWFFDVGTHDATPQRARWIRTLACRAVAVAAGITGGPPGPVHLNWPLREPLLPPAEFPPDPQPGRADGRPWIDLTTPVAPAAPALRPIPGASRGVIVAGREGEAAARTGELLGWPVLADPLSGARTGASAIAHYDALLRDESFATSHRPEVVLRIGDLPTSKPLRAWLADLDVPQVAVWWRPAWPDPDGVLQAGYRRPVETVLPDGASEAFLPAPASWLAQWREADALAAQAIDVALATELTEPQAARALAARLPEDATLVVAASMPIRDVETFARRPINARVLANRGANGIDGTLATAFGVAAATDGPVAVLLGDVAFAHDLSALLCAKRHGHTITIVVLNNDGGGIFEFLPLAGIARATFEEHVATPPGLEIAQAATLFGCHHVAPADLAEFHAALDASFSADRTTIIEVRTEREANVALHRSVWAAVSAAVADPPA